MLLTDYLTDAEFQGTLTFVTDSLFPPGTVFDASVGLITVDPELSNTGTSLLQFNRTITVTNRWGNVATLSVYMTFEPPFLNGSLIRRRFDPGSNSATMSDDKSVFDAGFDNLLATQLVHVNSFFVPNEEKIAFEYTGWLTVPASGSYTFGVRSDDGSDVSLWMNSAWDVVTHAYGYKPVESTVNHPGTRILTTGVYYPIRVRYHEHTGRQALYIEWQTPSAPSTWVAIPFSNFHCNGKTPITTATLRENYPEPRVSYD